MYIYIHTYICIYIYMYINTSRVAGRCDGTGTVRWYWHVNGRAQEGGLEAAAAWSAGKPRQSPLGSGV